VPAECVFSISLCWTLRRLFNRNRNWKIERPIIFKFMQSSSASPSAALETVKLAAETRERLLTSKEEVVVSSLLPVPPPRSVVNSKREMSIPTIQLPDQVSTNVASQVKGWLAMSRKVLSAKIVISMSQTSIKSDRDKSAELASKIRNSRTSMRSNRSGDLILLNSRTSLRSDRSAELIVRNIVNDHKKSAELEPKSPVVSPSVASRVSGWLAGTRKELAGKKENQSSASYKALSENSISRVEISNAEKFPEAIDPKEEQEFIPWKARR
jgi:hypothetical protein